MFNNETSFSVKQIQEHTGLNIVSIVCDAHAGSHIIRILIVHIFQDTLTQILTVLLKSKLLVSEHVVNVSTLCQYT
jgi:hypothetical protein